MADPASDRNAAAIRALRSALEQAAREARSAQGQLEQATGTFASVASQVIAIVGGSAQGIDRDLVTSLDEAVRHSAAAVELLAAASSSSRGLV